MYLHLLGIIPLHILLEIVSIKFSQSHIRSKCKSVLLSLSNSYQLFSLLTVIIHEKMTCHSSLCATFTLLQKKSVSAYPLSNQVRLPTSILISPRRKHYKCCNRMIAKGTCAASLVLKSHLGLPIGHHLNHILWDLSYKVEK